MNRTILLLAIAAGAGRAATIAADSARGAKLFESLSCIECHSINGRGGTIAPDLGRHIDRNMTPATLAATMWNHAPTMWAAIRERKIQMGTLDQQGAADLFAFFYSAGFFDKPGDAGRGKQVFITKKCAECHGATDAKLPAAKPLAQWTAVTHPIALANAMWNHAGTMQSEFERRKIRWPELSSQDLTDLLVYARNFPPVRSGESRVEITAGAQGEALFQSKGCSACHTGKLALGPRLKGMTLTDIASAMWNHKPKMPKSPPELSVGEMRELISFLWAKQFFEDSGNPSAGARVFAAKSCAGCHREGGPNIPRGDFNGAAMISALWRHGPQMLAEMSNRRVAWPHLEGKQMADLIAYLNSRKP